VIVFILKHASAFESVCVNCPCGPASEYDRCSIKGGKWQTAQGETGLDVLARLAKLRHRWFADVDARCTTLILEANGDRTKSGGLKLNRPAYNEMTGSLTAFFLSNLARIRDNPDRLYGWLLPTTFYELRIEDFSETHANLEIALRRDSGHSTRQASGAMRLRISKLLRGSGSRLGGWRRWPEHVFRSVAE
jgi:hypothetical protein